MENILMITICVAIFLGTVVIGYLFVCIDYFAGIINSKKIKTGDVKIFEEAIRVRRVWKSIMVKWLVADYLLKILPFECSAIILYLDIMGKDGTDKTLAIFFFSIISMILIIVSFAVRSHNQMIAYRKAYLGIDYVVNQAIAGSTPLNDNMRKALVEAINTGEKYINKAVDIDGADNEPKNMNE